MDEEAFKALLRPYTISYTGRTRISFHIDSEGVLKISAPPGTPLAQIFKVVSQNFGWVERMRLQQKQSRKVLDYDPETSLFYHGEKYTLSQDGALLYGIRIDPEFKLLFYAGNPKVPMAYVWRFLRVEAEKEIAARVSQLIQYHELSTRVKSVVIKDFKSKFGHCSSKGDLALNWRLIIAPPAVLDYVIYHEFSHLFFFNHSPDFWDKVASYDPQFKVHRQWLRSHQQFFKI